MEQRSATGGDHFVEDTYLAPQFGMLEFLQRLREDQFSVPVPGTVRPKPLQPPFSALLFDQ